MILVNDIAKELTITDKNFESLKDNHKKLRMHVEGINVIEYIDTIEQFENDKQKDVREKYLTSNKSLFSSLLQPINKIFSAKGGNNHYYLKTENLITKFIAKLNHLKEGSLEKWLKTYWKDKLIIDPNGIFLIENKDNEAYPTYKSILSIRKYKKTGQKIDWIIFEPYKIDKKEYVRVYDDKEDRLFEWDGEKLTLIKEQTFKNIWGYVPAIIISDIKNTITGYNKSPIENEVELADDYLLTGSIKNVFKFKIGFPFLWMYKPVCTVCKGSGEVNNKICPACNGTRYGIRRDISDILLLNVPEDSEAPIIAPNIAGYVSPESSILGQFNSELTILKTAMEYSHWNSAIEHEKSNTATGRWIDAQPVIDRLNQYREGYENVKTLLTNFLGEFYYQNNYEGCSINEGRRYLIETPDQLIEKYIKAKKDGTNEVVLNYMIMQYYYTEFQNDLMQLEKHKKLLEINPFPHHTVAEVAGWNISEDDKKRKIYYNEWVLMQKDIDIVKSTKEQLIKSLNKYISSKIIINQNLKP